jgi:PAS domain-containing protein
MTSLASLSGLPSEGHGRNSDRDRVLGQENHLGHSYRELLEALPAAIYTTDAVGRITFYNQASPRSNAARSGCSTASSAI